MPTARAAGPCRSKARRAGFFGVCARSWSPSCHHDQVLGPRCGADRPQTSHQAASLWVFLAAVAGFAAACAPIGDPDLGAGTGTETTVVADADAENDGASPEESVELDDGVVADQAPLQVFSPPRPQGYVPSLLVIAQEDISILDSSETGFGEQVDLDVGLGGAAVTVVDDFFGGLVVQQVADDETPAVVWLRADGSAATPIATGGERLLDVGFIDSTIQAHALIESTPQLVERVPLGEGERAVLVQLDESQTIIDLSASEGLFAISVADSNCGALIFVDSSGTDVPVGGPGTPPCAVGRRPAYGAIALSPDATRIAYTTRTYRSDGVVATTDLIVQELGTDVVLFDRMIGGAGENVDDLSFDGLRLVFTRQQAELTQVVELTTDAEGEERLVAVSAEPSSVVFARQPITLAR